MLIFASISFLIPPTLTIQPVHLLMQIKFNPAYHLMGIIMIYLGFSKSWKSQAFPFCCFCVQKQQGIAGSGWMKIKQFQRGSSR
ncbi:hypothetical protein CD006_27480 [Enterobacter sp. 10-1]|nr:hypothetical protein CD006_27480 [Enterobacter sp. 10-1]